MAFNTLLDAETLLTIDVGSINTRANLFDVVDGRYRLIATGRAPSTAGAPIFDVSEGVRMALDRLQAVTGRTLVDESDTLIRPMGPDGSGIDVFVATSSAGPKVRTVLVGLMPGVSLQSAQNLAETGFLEVVGEIHLLDRRQEEEQINLILSSRPDLILIAGGTDEGAVDSIQKMVEVAAVSVELIPSSERPMIVFAGNQQLGEQVVDRFGNRAQVVLAPNIRPQLEVENLSPARLRLTESVADVRAARVAGFSELEMWSGGYMMLTAEAFGRTIRYQSQVNESGKGVLGVDLGASQITVAAGFDGELRLNVYPDLGIGEALPGILRSNDLDDIRQWLPVDIPPSEIRNFIYNKALHPQSIPINQTEIYLELALARQLTRTALLQSRRNWPSGKDLKSSWMLPPMDPIILSGAVFSRLPRPGFAALALLDSLQPTGITTMLLDPHNLTPALGAAAAPLPMVTVQVMETGGYVVLGTAICPVGRGRMGRRVLKFHLERYQNRDVVGEVRMGQLMVVPLGPGEVGRLTLRPEGGIDVGLGGPGKAGVRNVAGGAAGLIIDARGRPLPIHRDIVRQQEINYRWLYDIEAIER